MKEVHNIHKDGKRESRRRGYIVQKTTQQRTDSDGMLRRDYKNTKKQGEERKKRVRLSRMDVRLSGKSPHIAFSLNYCPLGKAGGVLCTILRRRLSGMLFESGIKRRFGIKTRLKSHFLDGS